MEDNPPLIELIHVTKTYQENDIQSCPLQDVSISIRSKDFIAIVGPSGTGKSTLFRMLCRLEDPDSGTLLFENRPLSAWNPNLLRRKVHYVYQTPILFLDTVAQNLAYPLKLQGKVLPESEMESLLTKVGLPLSLLQRPIDQLSGGEKQRVSLARSLSIQPDVLLLDEPTSSLDQATASLVEETISQYQKDGHTVLWITHQLDQGKKLAHRIWHLKDGKIQEEMNE